MEVASLIAGSLLVSLGAAGGYAIATLEIRRCRAEIERLVADLADERADRAEFMGMYDRRIGEFTDRLMSMRQSGFDSGGGLPEPTREPLPAEIESFLSELDPESASLTREWAFQQRDAGIGDAEIYERLTIGGDAEAVIGA